MAASYHKEKLRDQILCSHGARARCLNCMGRGLLKHAGAPEAFRIYEDIFSGNDVEKTKQISKESKVALNDIQGKRSLAYGEVSFWSFAHILEDCEPGSDWKFVDLGSGVGRAVVIASLLNQFRSCVGIEIVPEIHSQAETIASRSEKHNLSNIELLCGDFFELSDSWVDADIVFCASTAFSETIMKKIAEICDNLRQGAVVITFSVKLPSAKFTVFSEKKYRVSWGNVTVISQRRK